jgi:hypothetical protein
VDLNEDLSCIKVEEDEGILEILRELVKSRKLVIRSLIMFSNW